MRRALIPLFFTTLLIVSHAASAETYFYANIDGAQAGTGASGTGKAVLILNDAETELRYHYTFTGLTGAATGAHIHSDAEGGGVVHPVSASSPSTGVWTSGSSPALTAARVTDLKNGLLYFNIHTGANPGGEIKGQIILQPGAIPTLSEWGMIALVLLLLLAAAFHIGRRRLAVA